MSKLFNTLISKKMEEYKDLLGFSKTIRHLAESGGVETAYIRTSFGVVVFTLNIQKQFNFCWLTASDLILMLEDINLPFGDK